MYSLSTEHSFDAAHFLAGYNGKCRNIHGHRWRVVVEVQSEKLKEDEQQREMCVDFSELKKDLREEVDNFDHAFIIERQSLKEIILGMLREEGFVVIEVDFRPTAENFAKYFYGQMKKRNYDVAAVHVYETPNNCATYREQS